MNHPARNFLFIFIALVVGFVIGFYSTQFFDSQEEVLVKSINSFEDCIAAGNPAMESYPRQCRTQDGQHFVEVIEGETVDQNNETVCTAQYDPVCGEIDVQCIKAPCPPVKETFSNFCFANKAGAKNIIKGECNL